MISDEADKHMDAWYEKMTDKYSQETEPNVEKVGMFRRFLNWICAPFRSRQRV